jgi:hypothetical protein
MNRAALAVAAMSAALVLAAGASLLGSSPSRATATPTF